MKLDIDNIPIDSKGHFRNNISQQRRQFVLSELIFQVKFFEEHKNNKLYTGMLDNYLSREINTFTTCSDCGNRFKLKFDEKRNKLISTDECKYPKGFPSFKFKIPILSGFMVIGNDFRREFQTGANTKEESYDVNNIKGQYDVVKFYEKIELAHACVSNTSPEVFKVNDSQFFIGTRDEDEKPLIKNVKSVGRIITDLWWFSICDYDKFVSYFKRKPNKKQYEYKVECTPGVYEFIHHYHLLDQDFPSSAQKFTDIKLCKRKA